MRHHYLLVLLLASCAADPDVATTEDPITTCPKWGCGENSPVMGPYNFHELNLNGIPNDSGVVVLDFQKNGVYYTPMIVGAKLYARNSTTLLKGAALQDGWFDLKTPGYTQPFHLYINHVSTDPGEPYWVGTYIQNETYELLYDGPPTPNRTPLCNNPPSTVYAPDDQPNTYNTVFESLLFTGDRYNATTKTVTSIDPTATAGWMNVACAGSAIAKLHLNRYTTAGSPGPNNVTTSQKERQALLKMFVSDNCGTGQSFTVKGTPLYWNNTYQWKPLYFNASAHEAYWNENGAVCLDADRLGPDMRATIEQTCPKPICNSSMAATTYVTSSVP